MSLRDKIGRLIRSHDVGGLGLDIHSSDLADEILAIVEPRVEAAVEVGITEYQCLAYDKKTTLADAMKAGVENALAEFRGEEAGDAK